MVEYIPFKGGDRPFSSAVRAGDTLYVSGQVGIDRSTGSYPSTVEEQTELAIENLRELLEENGFTLAEVVRMGAILLNKADITGFNAVYQKHFNKRLPARTLTVVSALAGDAIVELEATCVKQG